MAGDRAAKTGMRPSKRRAGIFHDRRLISGRVVRVGRTVRPLFRNFGSPGTGPGYWLRPRPVRSRFRGLAWSPGGDRRGLAGVVIASRPYVFGPARSLRRLRRLAMTDSGVRHRRRSPAGQMSADQVGDAAGVQHQGDDSLGEPVAPSPHKTSPTGGEAWRRDTTASRFRESPDGCSLPRRFWDTPTARLAVDATYFPRIMGFIKST